MQTLMMEIYKIAQETAEGPLLLAAEVPPKNNENARIMQGGSLYILYYQ